MESLQVVHIAVEIAILIAVVRATITVARMEFRVELMWEEFSRRLKFLENIKEE